MKGFPSMHTEGKTVRWTDLGCGKVLRWTKRTRYGCELCATLVVVASEGPISKVYTKTRNWKFTISVVDFQLFCYGFMQLRDTGM